MSLHLYGWHGWQKVKLLMSMVWRCSRIVHIARMYAFIITVSTARAIAEKYFANHNAKGDANEPHFDGENVHLIPETREAWQAFSGAGFLAAGYDEDEGGLQLPEVILRTAMAYINAANIATTGYLFLSIDSRLSAESSKIGRAHV